MPFPLRALRRATLAAGLATAVGLTACAPSDSEPAAATEAESAELTSIRIGYFPLVHTASVVHAVEAGYFEAEGLDVELVTTGGGATSIPPLVAGEYEITYGNYTSILLGAQQGLPLAIVAGNDVGASDHGIIVTGDSDLNSPADLVGRSVAVNNLQNIGMVAVRSVVEDAGGDPDGVQFLELAYPEMGAALERGDVDAIWQVEPFQAIALDAGNRVLFELFSGPVADMPVAGWVSQAAYVEANPEVVEAFRRGLAAAIDDLQDNRDLLVQLVPTFTEVSPGLVEQVSMPVWDAQADLPQLQRSAELMLEHEVIDQAFDVSTILLP